jgi:predicted GNAT superfamily acetyltransferase
MQLSDITDADLGAVVALNEASVPHVSSFDLEQLRWFTEQAFYFRVAHVDDRFAGFLIGIRPGINYNSENYRWFTTTAKIIGGFARTTATSDTSTA